MVGEKFSNFKGSCSTTSICVE